MEDFTKVSHDTKCPETASFCLICQLDYDRRKNLLNLVITFLVGKKASLGAASSQ